jgi:hypothetical protein
MNHVKTQKKHPIQRIQRTAVFAAAAAASRRAKMVFLQASIEAMSFAYSTRNMSSAFAMMFEY